ncbi:MAG: Na+/H+ antiporter NhaA [Dehalococcoidia bacterium]
MDQARQFVAPLQEFSIALILGVFAGLVMANVDQQLYQAWVNHPVIGEGAGPFGHELTIHFLINEVFMVFFFGIAAKEITESLLPGGALNPVRKAVNPLLGTLGGVMGPAGLYFLLTFAFYGGSEHFGVVANGWGIPTATDIALAWLVARMVFGRRHPAVNFLLLLAVADDGIGLGIIAGFYPDPELSMMPVWLLLTVGAMGVALAMRRLKVNNWVPYIAVAGVLSWVGLLKASIEPALALVPIVPFLPTTNGPELEPGHGADGHGSDTGLGSVVPGASPLEQFENRLKPIVDFGLFFFAFANAGVAFSTINQVTVIVLLSLVVGKTVGISSFSLAAAKIGFPLPTGMGARHLLVAALIAGLGLTVALFVAGKAFSGPPFQDAARMGAVLSGSVALLALAVGAAFKVKEGAEDTSLDVNAVTANDDMIVAASPASTD